MAATTTTAYSPVATEARGVVIAARGVWNIRNVIIARVDGEGGRPVVTAAWLSTHDGVMERILASTSFQPRKRYTISERRGNAGSAIHLRADDDGRVYALVTKNGSEFPARVAHAAVDELQRQLLLSPHDKESRNATTMHELSSVLTNLFDSIVDKFDDPTAVGVTGSTPEVTTSIMQENIALLMRNDDVFQDVHVGGVSDAEGRAIDDQQKRRTCKLWICYMATAFGIVLVIIIPMLQQPSKT